MMLLPSLPSTRPECSSAMSKSTFGRNSASFSCAAVTEEITAKNKQNSFKTVPSSDWKKGLQGWDLLNRNHPIAFR